MFGPHVWLWIAALFSCLAVANDELVGWFF